MLQIVRTVLNLQIWRDRRGQDLIEYALMAALIATGVVTMSPQVAASFADILSKVNAVVVSAGSN